MNKMPDTFPAVSVYLINHLRMAQARRWYDSPEYQRILPLGMDSAISDLILVSGVAPDCTPADLAQQIRAENDK